MEVLFKPTKASEVPIRHDYDQAVSYFVGAAAAGDDIGINHARDVAVPEKAQLEICLLYTSPSPRDQRGSRMPSSA